MNDHAQGSVHASAAVKARLAKRHANERRFKFLGLTAISIGLVFLFLLFGSIVKNGYGAFWQTHIALDVMIDAERLGVDADTDDKALRRMNFSGLVKSALRERFPDVTGRKDKRKLYKLVSTGAQYILAQQVIDDRSLLGTTARVWLPADDDVDMLIKGHIDRELPETERRIDDQALAWIDTLMADGRIEQQFNTTLFSAGDSREPELAGLKVALLGSLLTLIVTLGLSFPIGVSTAVYLEEFAPKNKWTDIIEVNINNLAAVPSIVFGLLGLAVFINFAGLPRSAPLVGGLVLTLMTLPTIIVASRAALKAVPPSIRDAALGMGASRTQMVSHHVLPSAMPGMLTGTIIGMAQALGETAPLLMIGMVAFIADPPSMFTDPATALPVQIFLWADSPERAFVERTSAAIMILLAFLIAMNAIAVLLRKRFERRW